MRYLLIAILFSITINAQTIWYVDRDASGSANGTSWTNAWTSVNNIVWASISAGDTIYVSGGTDTTFYYQNDIYVFPYVTFASGNPVVIAPAWHSGHNGRVVFTTYQEAEQYMFMFMGVSNVKMTGFTFWDRRTERGMSGILIIGAGDDAIQRDSMQTVENCHIIGSGLSNGLFLYGYRITIKDCIIENEENDYATPQDMLNSSSGMTGHTIDGNVIIYRSGYEIATGSGANVTYTDTSVTDTDKSWTVDYYKDAQAYIGAGGNSVRVTGNTSNTIYVASWTAGTPANGTIYETDNEHNDGIQFSNFYMNPYRPRNTVSNNIIIDTRVEGTGWNNMIYNYSDWNTAAHEWLIYNNIFYTQKTKTSVGGIGIGGSEEPLLPITLKVFNNTFIIKGSGGTGSTPITTWRVDTLIVKNNLIISDTIPNNMLNLALAGIVYQDIDYNFYAKSGGIISSTRLATQSSVYTWDQWTTAGYDLNSFVGNSLDVTYANKGGTAKADYYTTTGRDSGVDLSATYPFLAYDILGNPRSGSWDMGSLEWQGDVTDTIPTYTFTATTNVELNSYNIRSAVFANADSIFTVWTETADSFKVGALSSYDIIEVEAEAGDTVFITNIASGLYETETLSYIRAGGNTQSYSVTTKSEPVVPVTGSKILKGNNGLIMKDRNGKIIRTLQ